MVVATARSNDGRGRRRLQDAHRLRAIARPHAVSACRQRGAAAGGWTVCACACAHRLLLERFDELLAALKIVVEALHRPNDLLHLVLLCALELAQVLQWRVEPFAIFPQALLTVVDVAIDLDNLSLQHVPMRLQAREHVDQIRLGLLSKQAPVQNSRTGQEPLSTVPNQERRYALLSACKRSGADMRGASGVRQCGSGPAARGNKTRQWSGR